MQDYSDLQSLFLNIWVGCVHFSWLWKQVGLQCDRRVTWSIRLSWDWL